MGYRSLTPHRRRGGKVRYSRGREPLEFVDTAGAAAILKITPRQLEHLRRRGGGPKYVAIGSRCVRYRVSAIREWAEAIEQGSTSEDAMRED